MKNNDEQRDMLKIMTSLPDLPIPEPMRGREPNTWANRTITNRFADTIRRTISENDFVDDIQRPLLALIADIPQAQIRYLDDPQAPDVEHWNGYIELCLGQDWLQPPWFFVEHYYYRRIMEASGYFGTGPGQSVDLFAVEKRSGLEQSGAAIVDLAERLNDWLQADQPQTDILQALLYLDLWGNQADYSLWPADADGAHKPDHADIAQASDFLLCDDSSQVSEHLSALRGAASRVDFLIDNAGMELVADLALADYLLSSLATQQVNLHLKAHPTFVSDALPKDVHETVEYLAGADDLSVEALGSRLRHHLDEQRLLLSPAFFWNSPLDGWQMPADLRDDLSAADLVISKGDANYRRLLGDRHWPYDTPFGDVLAYFPAPLVALRTLKSECVCGLPPGKSETVLRRDPEWMINGRWGLIQFSK
jgi:uncharacterized protein with ATP-grasp and redox domains